MKLQNAINVAKEKLANGMSEEEVVSYLFYIVGVTKKSLAQSIVNKAKQA